MAGPGSHTELPEGSASGPIGTLLPMAMGSSTPAKVAAPPEPPSKPSLGIVFQHLLAAPVKIRSGNLRATRYPIIWCVATIRIARATASSNRRIRWNWRIFERPLRALGIYGSKIRNIQREMAVKDRVMIDFESAFDSPDPLRELRDAVALQLHGRDTRREELLDMLDEERLDLRAAGREREEDTVAEVMDFLVGWCSPHARL
jgi:hypothetical protein